MSTGHDINIVIIVFFLIVLLLIIFVVTCFVLLPLNLVIQSLILLSKHSNITTELEM